jgi:hypothetical protein
VLRSRAPRAHGRAASPGPQLLTCCSSVACQPAVAQHQQPHSMPAPD